MTPSWTHSISRALAYFLPKKDHVTISGSIIPSPDRRWCGPEFRDDDFYLNSAEAEAHRLINRFQCTRQHRILDVGCGQGRLPIGLLRVLGELTYTGIDVDRGSIDWCNRYIGRNHPSFTFNHLKLYNERYNRKGVKIDEDFRFALADKSVDIIYLYSVFSHMTQGDMRIYLREFSRILDDRGGIFFTTFVEKNVPPVSINPEHYRLKTSGPLHIVRYDQTYLFSILAESGFSVMGFDYGTETDGQSAIYLKKINS